MVKIQFSPEAAADLQQIKAYITEDLCNEQAAVATIAKITKQIRILSDYPESGAPLSSIIDMETHYRFLVCGHYTAFYRVKDHTVYIVRILYGRRNFAQILFPEPQDN